MINSNKNINAFSSSAKLKLYSLWGSYLGLVLGLVTGYFSLAFVFHMAEIGHFTRWFLALPFFPPILGFVLGGLLHRFIKNKKS